MRFLKKIESDSAERIGISYYSTSSEGTGGEIKRRINDFIVEEIDEKGKLHEIKAFEGEEKKEVKVAVPEKNGSYLIAELEKYNIDTNQAIRQVARWMQSSRYAIGYAGMKDKRAITCQLVSIKENNIERLTEFNSRYLDVRPLYWVDKGMEIGGLQGNKFTVTIRKINEEEEVIRKKAENSLNEMKSGIANYFGPQRFGGIRSLTHLVGKQFVRGNFREGVMTYLCEHCEEEEDEVKEARKNLKDSQDFSRATKEFPVKYRYERAIIHELCKNPNDFVNAFHQLPKGLRFMFTHAYQSYLFNRCISKRFEKGIGIKTDPDDILDNGFPTAALFGHESLIYEGIAGDIEKEVLEEEELDLEEFKIKQMPELTSRGTRRSIVVVPKYLELIEIGDDEFNEGTKKLTLSFSLNKGSYATIALAEIIKNGLCL